jgi:hypothetical protein
MPTGSVYNAEQMPWVGTKSTCDSPENPDLADDGTKAGKMN